ncbi:hypothetical protein ASNO1_53220 [Corallococcus caeni]|uniref:Uncharacterized protein n=1 Tax=Corallococcus caeni TaxID=3082388 RepID=A0ABQ6QYF3_9BACT|nr:hypothetical protein ASNO1_53220 [Corallococcus sp. NO1]
MFEEAEEKEKDPDQIAGEQARVRRRGEEQSVHVEMDRSLTGAASAIPSPQASQRTTPGLQSV